MKFVRRVFVLFILSLFIPQVVESVCSTKTTQIHEHTDIHKAHVEKLDPVSFDQNHEHNHMCACHGGFHLKEISSFVHIKSPFYIVEKTSLSVQWVLKGHPEAIYRPPIFIL
jgi:ABC-type nickel/cobalt efflux system permease component RcnA